VVRRRRCGRHSRLARRCLRLGSDRAGGGKQRGGARAAQEVSTGQRHGCSFPRAQRASIRAADSELGKARAVGVTIEATAMALEPAALSLVRIVAVLSCAVLVASSTAASAQVSASGAHDGESARITLPPIGLRARDIAVVVNDADAASVEVGRYYAKRRGIAADRVIHVRFAAGQGVMGFADFERVQAVLDARVGADVQAYALAWTLPYRVECMSVTAAFAFGFDPGS